MLKTSLKSRLHPNKHTPKNNQEPNKIKSILPPHLYSFKQKLLSGNDFIIYKGVEKIFNY